MRQAGDGGAGGLRAQREELARTRAALKSKLGRIADLVLGRAPAPSQGEDKTVAKKAATKKAGGKASAKAKAGGAKKKAGKSGGAKAKATGKGTVARAATKVKQATKAAATELKKAAA